MAVEERPAHAPIADPAALGLGGFALTTFVLSAHNADWAPADYWIGLAIFYGGLAQFLAGMWEFRRNNTFAATAFSTYGAFWLALGTFVLINDLTRLALSPDDTSNSLGWWLLAFAIFNTYMLFWSTRINMAVFLVFLTLEVTEILLFWGFFNGDGAGEGLVQLGGYMGIVTALVAWYTSAAVVVNNMGVRPVVPVGSPLWSEAPTATRGAPGAAPGAR